MVSRTGGGGGSLYSMVTPGLVHVHDSRPIHAFHWEAVQHALQCLKSGKSTSIGLPAPSVLQYVVGYAALLDYAEWAMERKDFLSRATFGILLPFRRMTSLFAPIMISTEFIVTQASPRRQSHALVEMNARVNMDDPRWGYIWWSHWLKVRYGDDLPPRLPLWHLFPAARLTGPEEVPEITHARDYLGRYDAQPPSFVIAEDPQVFSSVPVYGLIVDLDWWEGDLPAPDWTDRPVLTLWSDPVDPRVPRALATSYEPYVFSREAAESAERICLACQGDASGAERERSRLLRSRPKVHWEIIRHPDINDALAEINDLLAELSRTQWNREDRAFQRFVHCTNWVRSIVRSLVVPIQDFDAVAAGSPFHRTTLDLAAELKDLAMLIHQNAPWMGAIAEDLTLAVDRLIRLNNEGTPPKHELVMRLVKDQYDQGLSCAVVVQSKIHQQALMRRLASVLGEQEEDLPEAGVHVLPVTEFLNDPSDRSIITCVGQRLLRTCLSGISGSFEFLYYPDEIAILSRREWGTFRQVAQLSRAVRMPFTRWVEPFMPPHVESSASFVGYDEAVDKRSGIGSLWTSRDTPDEEDASDVLAYRFWSHEAFVYVPRDSRVRILDRLRGSIVQVAASSVGEGSVVVMIQGAVRDSYYGILLDLLHDTPDMKPHLENIELWHRELRTGYRKYRSWLPYSEILRRIRQLGSSIQATETVRNWVKADVMGPDDPEDVRRMGEVLGSEVLKNNWRAVARSLETIRRLHRVVATELNEVIFGDRRTEFRHPLLRDSGITPADFRGALEFVRVTKVESPRPVSPRLVGFLLGGRQDDDCDLRHQRVAR